MPQPKLKPGQLTAKDMSVLREGDSIREQVKAPAKGVLRDYSLNHRVEMRWDLNEEANRDRIFELKIDDYTVLLDYEEFLRYGRLI